MAVSRWKNLVGRAWLRCFGWTVDPEVPDARKAIVVAAPHTSNWDFPFTMAVSWALGIDIAWLGKQSMFIWPFRGVLRSWGGVPVDRSASHDMVSHVAGMLRGADDLFVILSPEGTRSSVRRWKTGFYHMAVQADVPIVLGYLDYGKKRGGLGKMFRPSGDLTADAEAIRAFYKDIAGKRRAQFTEITLDLSATPEKKRAA